VPKNKIVNKPLLVADKTKGTATIYLSGRDFGNMTGFNAVQVNYASDANYVWTFIPNSIAILNPTADWEVLKASFTIAPGHNYRPVHGEETGEVSITLVNNAAPVSVAVPGEAVYVP
jgi:hypothetical protein